MKSGSTADGELLWTPSREWTGSTRMADYMKWLAARGIRFENYAGLWEWSVDELDFFWASIWDYFEVISSARWNRVVGPQKMPGVRWFEGARLNWAENLLRWAPSPLDAVTSVDEGGYERNANWAELSRQAASLAYELRNRGVERGDRVAGYVTNTLEAVVGLLATASIGAVWSCCSPEFGAKAVVDRFRQIGPKVLIAVDGYVFQGRKEDRLGVVEWIRSQLPTVEWVIVISQVEAEGRVPRRMTPFGRLVERNVMPSYEQVDFGDPLWILYSSGTTGVPKCIVHSHGGILLEALKANALHYDVRQGDRVFILASTSWVVWNMLVNALSVGASIVCYDGSPVFPTVDRGLRLAAECGVQRFGTGAAYLERCARDDDVEIAPARFGELRTVMSTGSPLAPLAWRWVYDRLGGDILLGSDSGGTDVATGFVGTNPLLPVYSGESQSAYLGVVAESWSEEGRPVVGQVGELVIRKPMPSMPVGFWGDVGHREYRDAYFDVFPYVWRHGDWVVKTERDSFRILGRSDATLKRGGVRMGSAEIYGVVEADRDVEAALVVGAELPSGRYFMPLFVQLVDGIELDDALILRLKRAIRKEVSPRHVPDEIIAVPKVPVTKSGKKLEVPIKRILEDEAAVERIELSALADPDSVKWFVKYCASARLRV